MGRRDRERERAQDRDRDRERDGTGRRGKERCLIVLLHEVRCRDWYTAAASSQILCFTKILGGLISHLVSVDLI